MELTLNDAFDIRENFVFPLFRLTTCNEVWRQFLPLFREFAQVVLDVSRKLPLRQLVGFREDDTEGDSVLAKPFDEFEVDTLRLVTRIDEQEEVHHLLPSQDVTRYHPLQLVPLLLPSLRISVAGKVHKIPVLVNQKMVDEDGFAWSCRCFGEMLSSSQHIDEAGFSNIASPYKSELRQFSCRTLVHASTTDGIFGRFDEHLRKGKSI